ncbi:MAG: thiamine phosphate synthase [Oscillibacter sp.]|nr:thiamine phosphate synthase [Oscillibacter sp.]
MSEIMCVTNRRLCREDFLTRMEAVAAAAPAGVILREKDLAPDDYRVLAQQALAICRVHATPCIFHSFPQIALELGADGLHLPLPLLRTLSPEEREKFPLLGASCHSVEDAQEAERLGCTYITAGHIFATDCKKGLPPRGLSFLREVCRTVQIPVWAIGGIEPENFLSVMATGAQGGCVMSGLMTCSNPKVLLQKFHTASA